MKIGYIAVPKDSTFPDGIISPVSHWHKLDVWNKIKEQDVYLLTFDDAFEGKPITLKEIRTYHKIDFDAYSRNEFAEFNLPLVADLKTYASFGSKSERLYSDAYDETCCSNGLASNIAVANSMINAQQFINVANGEFGNTGRYDARRAEYADQHMQHGWSQPVYFDCHGTARFKPNKIVQELIDTHPDIDMNTLAYGKFSNFDRQQFAQLIGYSVSGFGELSYVDNYAWRMAEGATEYARLALMNEWSNLRVPVFDDDDSTYVVGSKSINSIDTEFVLDYLALKNADVSLLVKEDSYTWSGCDAYGRCAYDENDVYEFGAVWKIKGNVLYYNTVVFAVIDIPGLQKLLAADERKLDSKTFQLTSLLSSGMQFFRDVVSVSERACKACALRHAIKAGLDAASDATKYTWILEPVKGLIDGTVDRTKYRSELMGHLSLTSVIMATDFPYWLKVLLVRANALACNVDSIIGITLAIKDMHIVNSSAEDIPVNINIYELTNRLIKEGFIITNK